MSRQRTRTGYTNPGSRYVVLLFEREWKSQTRINGEVLILKSSFDYPSNHRDVFSSVNGRERKREDVCIIPCETRNQQEKQQTESKSL